MIIPDTPRSKPAIRGTVEALILVKGEILPVVTEDLRGYQAQACEGLTTHDV